MSRQSIQVWTLQLLFTFRVLGQLIVALYAPSWLPPMQEWYSGLIAYPYLLPIQLALLLLMTKLSLDHCKQSGIFYVTQSKTKIILRSASYIYFTIMLFRYVISRYLFADLPWYHGAIPIVFHWVLARYIYMLTVQPTHQSSE